MKIAIIGAGWFGCHLASELKNDGHSILLFEKEKDIFAGASGNNQNRLHLGYHYPRSYITREQSKKGFKTSRTRIFFIFCQIFCIFDDFAAWRAPL